MDKQKMTGHLLALFSMIVWGTTYIASKMLLEFLQPTQLLALRFFVAYVVSWCCAPRWYPFTSWREELGFISLAFFGIVGYYYLENVGLLHTSASNVSIIISAAPMFTALAAHLVLPDEKMTRATVLGFVVAMAGVVLVVGNGALVLKMSPKGDFLALGAAMIWAVYSVQLKGHASRMDQFILTRRMLFYALCMVLPILAGSGQLSLPWEKLLRPMPILCLAELAILGSCLCYVAWNHAVTRLGVVKTNNYIYIGPFITMITAALTIGEPVSLAGVVGTACIIVGVVLAGRQKESKELK